MNALLHYSDMEQHGHSCQCGACNSQGKSYGYRIINIDGLDQDDEEQMGDAMHWNDQRWIQTVYGPSEDAAIERATAVARSLGFTVVGHT